jgi:3-phosphoglycerate kinase
MSKITFIDEANIINKKVLIRVDFNVSLSSDKLSIADDARITQTLPTIKLLLQNKNKLILISHLGRPKERDPKLSLEIVARRLHELIPEYDVILINDFLQEKDRKRIGQQKENEIIILENIRFYPEEKANDEKFAKSLSSLADCFVNDAFGVCHRQDASVVGIPKFLPSYSGLLLKKEIEMISKAITNPKKPVVAIIGGAKISSKISLLGKLMDIADYLLVGGGLANTFFCAQGYGIGHSYCELTEVESAKKLLFMAAQKKTSLVLPSDVIENDCTDADSTGQIKKVSEIDEKGCILDIGPETQAKFGSIINLAKTIIWNGPVGYIENPGFRRGTDFIYYSIAQNTQAISIVGGGDTLAAISKKEYLDKITHVSTGGGAMLEFIEKGTLPGIEALKK